MSAGTRVGLRRPHLHRPHLHRPHLHRPHMPTSLERWIGLLVVLNVLVVASLLAVVVIDQFGGSPGHPAQAQPSPTASTELFQMGLAHIPTSAACVLCHESGGSASLKVIPAIAHPLEGWRECSVCHTNEKLGRIAPGHEGIPQSECLTCHTVAQPGPAITQPHSKLQDQHCLDCHGTYAHLPSSMASRDESTCTLCHKPTPLPPPEYPHALNPALSCRDCHQSAEVGNLPIDHALRADNTCLLCHDIKLAPGSSPILLPTLSPNPSPSGG
ncbi:MAG: hypothetical protein ACHQ15_03170 [Candidatus Limnocylindrales bacterium]